MIADVTMEPYYPQPKQPIAIVEKYIPEQTHNIQYHPPILNQGKQKGCVAFAIASMIEYYQRKNLCRIPLSAEALYYWTREVEGTTTLNIGTYPRDSFEIALTRGIPKEMYHENSRRNQFVEPSNQANRDAFINKIDAWKKLNFYVRDVNKSNLIAEQLANGDVVGISVRSSWNLHHPRRGIVNAGTFIEGSGHQLMVIDYKPDPKHKGERLFLCQNSWGTWYGIKPEGGKSRGFVWLTEGYIEQGCHGAVVIEWGKLHGIINSVDNQKGALA